LIHDVQIYNYYCEVHLLLLLQILDYLQLLFLAL
jgi:hypothetical protein